MGKIRVVTVDDHDIVRDGLRGLINSQPDMELVGEASCGEEALEKARSLCPDVMIVDIAMPGMNGLALVGLLREICPKTRVVIFSMYNKEAYVQQALVTGVLGYVLKTSSSTEVCSAVKAVYRGEYFLSSNIATDVISRYIASQKGDKAEAVGYDSLTEREQLIFRLMVEGKSTKDMADMLCLATKTVEKYRSSVMSKLDIHNLIDLMKYAVKIGIIDPELWEE